MNVQARIRLLRADIEELTGSARVLEGMARIDEREGYLETAEEEWSEAQHAREDVRAKRAELAGLLAGDVARREAEAEIWRRVGR